MLLFSVKVAAKRNKGGDKTKAKLAKFSILNPIRLHPQSSIKR